MANNYTGEPVTDRQPDDPPSPWCDTCGGPCKLEPWMRDGSWFSNNPNAFAAAIARRHQYFSREWIADVERQRVAIRALVLAPTFGCRGCGRFAFAVSGTVCFWCRERTPLHNPPTIQPVIQPKPAKTPQHPQDAIGLFAALAPAGEAV